MKQGFRQLFFVEIICGAREEDYKFGLSVADFNMIQAQSFALCARYAYLLPIQKGGRKALIIGVQDTEKTEKILEGNDIGFLSLDDLNG